MEQRTIKNTSLMQLRTLVRGSHPEATFTLVQLMFHWFKCFFHP